MIIETHSVYPPEESVVYQEGIRHGDRGGSTSFKPMLELGLSKKYVPAEEEAQGEKRGIWRGRFMKPWEWRRAKRLR